MYLVRLWTVGIFLQSPKFIGQKFNVPPCFLRSSVYRSATCSNQVQTFTDYRITPKHSLWWLKFLDDCKTIFDSWFVNFWPLIFNPSSTQNFSLSNPASYQSHSLVLLQWVMKPHKAACNIPFLASLFQTLLLLMMVDDLPLGTSLSLRTWLTAEITDCDGSDNSQTCTFFNIVGKREKKLLCEIKTLF